MNAPLRLFLEHVETPIGRFAIVADERAHLHGAGFLDGGARMPRQIEAYRRSTELRVEEGRCPDDVRNAIDRYFAGDLEALTSLVVADRTGTSFQRRVWTALRTIPCGATWSYGELARHIGRPAAVRAVGLANGANPVGVVVPCHRVIGSDGSLTGYGGGLERKRWLLAHEGARTPRQASLFEGR